ncbi:MAG: 4Fe-4S binding protein [Gemmatimonadetes bacterium]|nr:4Fe-4S binding protein [Gemmatimonadota bacterium]
MNASMILGSLLTLGGLGLVFATLIAVANKKLWVWEDPRIEAVTGMLPGTNCGACSFAGCRAFAEGLVARKAQAAGCTVMSPGAISDVADFLGVEAGEAVKRVARLLCAGGSNVAIQMARYRGLATCAAATAVASGGKGCTWGCVGLADCERACTFDAIVMNPFGIPVVIPELCTACGDCVVACPKDLFVLMPITHELIVQCQSLLAGEEVEALCRVACNACGRCVQDGAPGLIEIKDGLAVIDYGKIELAEPRATARCPTGAIVWLEGIQFELGIPLAASEAALARSEAA